MTIIPWYNMTQINGTSVLALAQSENNILMYGMLGNLLLLGLFLISITSMQHFNNNIKLNLMFSSLLIAIFSIFFKLLSLVQDMTVFICVAIFAFSTTYVLFTQ